MARLDGEARTTMIARLLLVTLAVGGSAYGQVIGALDFEVRASLEGTFSDVAVGAEGRVYLLDGKGEAVTVFSADLQRSLAVYDLKNSAGRIGRAVAIAVAADGSFWVADQGGTLAHLDPLGLPLGELRLPSKGGVTLQRPAAMSIAPDGAIVIADGSRRTVVVLDPDGLVRTQFHGIDARGVTFDNPIDIAVDRLGYIHVVDGSGGGVCKIDPWGVLRHRWPASLSGPTPLRLPRCVACDDVGLTFVADESGKCVVMADTAVVAMFGTSGRRPGQLQKPVAMAATAAGDIVIVDADPPRVQVFGIPTLQEVRRGVEFEERFLSVRAVPTQSWPWDGSRIDVRHGMIVLVGLDRKTVAAGPWAGGRERLQPVEPLAGRLKAASDVTWAKDGRVVVADEGARAILAVDPGADSPEAIPCPLGAWKSPVRLARGPDGSVVVWDRGHKALAFVLGERTMSIPVSVKDDVVDMVTAPEGDVMLFLSGGTTLRVKPDGTTDAGAEFPLKGLVAVSPGAMGVVAAMDEGGVGGVNWAGELLFLGGVTAGLSPTVVRAKDVAVDDSLIVVLTVDGLIVASIAENADRAGLHGRIEAQRPDTFSVRVVPSSGGGRPVTARALPGWFSIDGIVPGTYRWRIEAPGWLAVSGQNPIWLRNLRVTDLGTIVMKPAGAAVGLVYPAGASTQVSAVRGDTVVASTRTTAEGRFVLSDLPPGEYGLDVEARGFKAQGSLPRFTVPQGETVDIPAVSLVQLGSLKGYVKPLSPDQEVWLLRDGRLVRVCHPEPLADLSEEPGELLGRFECADIEPGLYSMAVRTRGFYPDTTLPPVTVEEGTVARCGTAILVAAPSDSAGAEALGALQRAMNDYMGARFTAAQETLERLLAARQVPYRALDRAYTLLGWCTLARGASHVETARACFRSALIVNPRVAPAPDASPTVTATMETVRRQLFGDAGPPADVFIP